MIKLVEITEIITKINWKCPSCNDGIMINTDMFDSIQGSLMCIYKCSKCYKCHTSQTIYPIISKSSTEKEIVYDS
jgi:hypothetical protein